MFWVFLQFLGVFRDVDFPLRKNNAGNAVGTWNGCGGMVDKPRSTSVAKHHLSFALLACLFVCLLVSLVICSGSKDVNPALEGLGEELTRATGSIYAKAQSLGLHQ